MFHELPSVPYHEDRTQAREDQPCDAREKTVTGRSNLGLTGEGRWTNDNYCFTTSGRWAPATATGLDGDLRREFTRLWVGGGVAHCLLGGWDRNRESPAGVD
jgi:hypothetical protein